MAGFEVTASAEGGRVLVTLAGECDFAVLDQLSASLLDAVRQAPTVVVDLAGLTFLDSSGLHGLVAAHRAALARHGQLHLVNARGAVATVLELTGVANLLSPPEAGDQQS